MIKGHDSKPITTKIICYSADGIALVKSNSHPAEFNQFKSTKKEIPLPQKHKTKTTWEPPQPD